MQLAASIALAGARGREMDGASSTAVVATPISPGQL